MRGGDCYIMEKKDIRLKKGAKGEPLKHKSTPGQAASRSNAAFGSSVQFLTPSLVINEVFRKAPPQL